MQNKKTWVLIFILISIEQLIKVVINFKFFEKNVPLFPPVLYFKPMFNRDYSWFNSMLQLGIGKWIQVAAVALMIILIFKFYQYLNIQLVKNKAIDILFAFIFSGALCSLIDKVIWNGSLDYILVKGFFTFDLKDVYINIFIGLLILQFIIKNKSLKQIDDNHLLKGFLKYIMGRP